MLYLEPYKTRTINRAIELHFSRTVPRNFVRCEPPRWTRFIRDCIKQDEIPD